MSYLSIYLSIHPGSFPKLGPLCDFSPKSTSFFSLQLPTGISKSQYLSLIPVSRYSPLAPHVSVSASLSLALHTFHTPALAFILPLPLLSFLLMLSPYFFLSLLLSHPQSRSLPLQSISHNQKFYHQS